MTFETIYRFQHKVFKLEEKYNYNIRENVPTLSTLSI